MFGAGFICGAIRVLALEPNIGQLAAVVVELPIMVVVCWRISRGYSISTGDGIYTMASLNLGVVAFLTLLVCELAMAVTMFNKTLWSALDEMILSNRPSARLGLAAQILCSLFPYINAVRSPQKHVKD